VNAPGATVIGDNAFTGCASLTTADFPKATTIGLQVFWDCTSLTSVNLTAVTYIGNYAFGQTGETALTITQGTKAPALGYGMFSGVAVVKTVIVRVPSGASGYDGEKQNAFKDGGNGNITLTIEEYTP
jgi:hypothetical protein